MRTYHSNDLTPADFAGPDSLYVYNGLDCCVTAEVIEPILRGIADLQRPYEFEKEMQGPALAMMLRGIKVNYLRRDERVADLRVKIARVEFILNKLAEAIWDKGLNAKSPKQLQAFFYGALKIEPILKRNKATGERVPSTDRNALEKLRDVYFYTRPIVNCILAIRELNKKISMLTTAIDRDGRMRVSFNVAGTETGRWSSSVGAFHTGTNAQNITEELRDVFIADDGYKLAYIDLEQAESWIVALCAARISGQENYLNAIKSGDLHTTVAKLVWPDAVRDRTTADAPYYRHFTYRDMSKRGGHGTNYYGTPPTMAMHLHAPVDVLTEFQRRYFSEFPEIRDWHFDVKVKLQTVGHMFTCFGRRRHFLGRRYDDATLREAIAHEPQSTVGDALNSGLLRIFYERRRLQTQLLLQVHDAILVQYPEHLEDEIIPQLIDLISVPLTIGKHTVRIPAEAKTGWNWGNQIVDKDTRQVIGNFDGLKKYKGHDDRVRQDRGPMDQVLHGVHKWAALAGDVSLVGGDLGSVGSPSPEGLRLDEPVEPLSEPLRSLGLPAGGG